MISVKEELNCVERYLKTRLPGIYHVLDTYSRLLYGLPLGELVVRDQAKVLNLLRRLYGDTAVETLTMMIDAECSQENLDIK